MEFKKQYDIYKKYFEDSLTEYFDQIKNIPDTLLNSTEYAIFDGGKRVRPVLCYSSAKMLGVDLIKVKNYALAIEMIHSYSLVHDDLPAMDNDDYRRGKFSTHKKFGEAYGILAGDGLLNLSFETMLKDAKDYNDILVMQEILKLSGIHGMIKGQVLDLSSEQSDGDEELLYDIYKNKTSALLTAPLIVPSILKNKIYYNELVEYGYNIGILFQITDDIMDIEGSLDSIGKTPNKDAEENKMTSIKIFGINGAKEKALIHYKKAKKIINEIPDSEFLSDFTDYLYYRKS